MQICGAKPIKDDKVKHAIESVARASIAEFTARVRNSTMKKEKKF